VKYAWIRRQRDDYDVGLLCAVLGVSRSGLHAAGRRDPSVRAQRNAQLVQQIRLQQQRHRGRYGRRRMHAALSEQHSRPINRKRIGRLMRQHGLQSQIRRRFRVVTTESKHAHPIAPNSLQRDFTASAPDRKWLADITYVGTAEGWLYVALVMDAFSRKFVGWAAGDSLAHDLTLDALRMALARRDPDAGQPGPFQLEAAIQAAHCSRARTGTTPWADIEQLYRQLLVLHPTVGAQLAYAIALSETTGNAQDGLAYLEKLDARTLDTHQPWWATLAYLLARAGRVPEAIEAYQQAAARTDNPALQQHLLQQMMQLRGQLH
jgi:tetratricopeptide (TPR) repeat protein